ncbi:MAG: YjbQ family protein, partial [Candidatus Hydrogenedentes bacterium]|nr:YjbQ family protein [Candidatus Hydrogenedentota bacterium]
MVHQDTIRIETRRHGEMHDITEAVRRIVVASDIKTGIVQVFNVGSTASIGCIEFEPGLERDLPEMLDRLIPP